MPIPGTTAVFTRRHLNARIDGLYHAIFRDGTEKLLAAAGPNIWNVWETAMGNPLGTSYAPALVQKKFPGTTVPSTWADATTGPIASVETVVGVDGKTWYGSVYAGNSPLYQSAYPPDIIQIFHGPQIQPNCIYEGRITGFSGAGPPYNIQLEHAASQPPQFDDTVVFFPHRTAADARFTMLNNRVFISSAAAANDPVSGPGWQTAQRQPPTVIEQDGGKGTTIYERRMGIRPPTFFDINYPQDTGNWNGGGYSGTGQVDPGLYRYRFTYVNLLNGQESEGGQESFVVSIGIPSAGSPPEPVKSSIIVSVKASPDPQVSAIRLYRTLANQDGAWYYVTQLYNVDQYWTDDIPDAGLQQLLQTFTNAPPPDSTCMLAVWTQAGALAGLDCGSIPEGGEQVIWSDAPDIVNGVYKLESFPLNNTLFVNRDDGDKLTSLGVFYDSMVVWKGRSMHRIVGAPPDIILQPISFRDDHTGVGIWSAKGFIMDADVAVFVSDDGFYQVSRYEGVQQGFTSSRISRQIDQEFISRTNQGPYSAQRHNRERSHLLYHRVKRRLLAFLPVDGNPDPTDSFVYQFEGTVEGTPHGWSLASVPIDYHDVGNPVPTGSFVSASAMVHPMMGPDAPYYGLGSFGLVVRGETGAGDWQGFPVTFEYDTVWFSAGGAGTVVRGRTLDFVLTATNGNPAVQAYVGEDFVLPPNAYALPQPWNPALGAKALPYGTDANQNILFLSLAQYHSLGMYEQSITGLFFVKDFTFWFQRLPVGVVPRIVPVTVRENPPAPAPWTP